MTIPNFVVAGAARSGTTALIEALRSHPDVFITRPKEPHYFAFAGQVVQFTGPGDQESMNDVAVTDRNAYLALYPRDTNALAIGEGSVSSLYYHDAAIPAIKELNENMKIVILLRNPVDRAYSSYQYLRARGLEPLENFADALDREPQRISDGWHHLWHYSAMGMYSQAVGKYLDAFGRDGVGVWFYDDFLDHDLDVVRNVCRFLTLDPCQFPDGAVSRVNVSGKPRSRSVQSLIQSAYRHQHVREAMKSLVPFRMREWVRGANLTASSVSPQDRRVLASRFAEDARVLEQDLGIPVPWASPNLS